MSSLINGIGIGQDEIIPIYITLQYEKYLLKFPVNPDNLTKEIPSDSATTDIEGIGQISIPTTPKLARITISSMFWSQIDLTPSASYVMWLEQWQRSKKPANLIVTRLNYSMKVTCESFKHWRNAGEENDVYFELQLQEYRPYGAKKLGVINDISLMKKLQKAKDLVTLPMLASMVRPTRDMMNKEIIENPYITKKNDTISSITKKITGSTDDWNLLYQSNISILGDIYTEKSEIPTGTKLILPDSWVENENYNIKTISL